MKDEKRDLCKAETIAEVDRRVKVPLDRRSLMLADAPLAPFDVYLDLVRADF